MPCLTWEAPIHSAPNTKDIEVTAKTAGRQMRIGRHHSESLDVSEGAGQPSLVGPTLEMNDAYRR